MGKKKKELLEQYMQYKDRPQINMEELIEVETTSVDDVININDEDDEDNNEVMVSEAAMDVS